MCAPIVRHEAVHIDGVAMGALLRPWIMDHAALRPACAGAGIPRICEWSASPARILPTHET